MSQDTPATDDTRLRVLTAGAIVSAALAFQNIHISLLTILCFM